jgi:hypothetical protein
MLVVTQNPLVAAKHLFAAVPLNQLADAKHPLAVAKYPLATRAVQSQFAACWQSFSTSTTAAAATWAANQLVVAK